MRHALRSAIHDASTRTPPSSAALRSQRAMQNYVLRRLNEKVWFGPPLVPGTFLHALFHAWCDAMDEERSEPVKRIRSDDGGATWTAEPKP